MLRVLSSVSRKGGEGCAKSLCSTRLISEALFVFLVQAEEEWSLCGMSTGKKKKETPPLWRGPVSGQLCTHKHTMIPKQGWKRTYFSSWSHTFFNLPSRSTHSPTQTHKHIHPHAHKCYSSVNKATLEFRLHYNSCVWDKSEPKALKTERPTPLAARLFRGGSGRCDFYPSITVTPAPSHLLLLWKIYSLSWPTNTITHTHTIHTLNCTCIKIYWTMKSL